MTTTALVRQLQQTVRRGRLLTAPAQLAGYDADGLGYKTFRPDAVVIPADAEELATIVHAARRLNAPVTIRGAGTSLSGGPVAAQGGLVVHTSSLRKVRRIAADGYWCEVECSVTLNQLDAALAPHGLFYPPDPSSGPVCTLGGNVAMNAGGAHCFRYGVTGNYVLGMEAVTLDGGLHRFGGPAGGRGDWQADWKRLMVGSEGTLAAFTRFWLRLLPRPEKCWTYRATFPDLHKAERAVHALALHSSNPVAIELMDPRCVALVENSPMAVGLPKDEFLIVTEIDGPASLVDRRAPEVAGLLRDAGASRVESSDDDVVRGKLWKARKVAGGLMGQMSPDFLVQDAVIPKRALAELLQLVYDEADAAGLPAVNVFHAGDGNLHPNFLFDSRKPGELEKVEAISKRLMQRVVEVGGTLSGEHGIGNDKTAYMPFVFGESALRLQLAVPRLFNPRHQLNPLKVFASRRFHADDAADDGAVAAVEHSEHSEPAEYDSHGSSLAPAARAGGADRRSDAPFGEFFDEIDGVICVPATIGAEELRARCRPHGFRFPLLLDENCSLREQAASSGYAPSSSRFGPYCDNILGMNWRLPSGRVLRIGERVVKSTTGYDLLRFLLDSDGRFGEPLDFVLRLRPDCGRTIVLETTGAAADVKGATDELVGSSWSPWFDSIEVRFDPAGAAPRLRVALNCPESERPVYDERFGALAAARRLTPPAAPSDADRLPGRPDFVLKTTADRAFELASRTAASSGATCRALAYNGVVFGHLPWSGERPDPAAAARQVDQIVRPLAPELAEVGGDWQSRHLARPAPAGVEAEWLKFLEQEFAAV